MFLLVVLRISGAFALMLTNYPGLDSGRAAASMLHCMKLVHLAQSKRRDVDEEEQASNAS